MKVQLIGCVCRLFIFYYIYLLGGLFMQQAFMQQKDLDNNKQSYLLLKDAVVEYVPEPVKVEREDVVKEWEKGGFSREHLEKSVDKIQKYNNAVERYEESLEKHERNIKTGYYNNLDQSKNLSDGAQSPKEKVEKYLKEEKDKLILIQKDIYANIDVKKNRNLNVEKEGQALKYLPRNGNVFKMTQKQIEALKDNVKNGVKIDAYLKSQQIEKKAYNSHLDLKLALAGSYMSQDAKVNALKREDAKVSELKLQEDLGKKNDTMSKDVDYGLKHEHVRLESINRKQNFDSVSFSKMPIEPFFNNQNLRMDKETDNNLKEKDFDAGASGSFDIKSNTNELKQESYAILGDYGYESRGYDWMESFKKTEHVEYGIENKDKKNLSSKDKVSDAKSNTSIQTELQAQRARDCYINSLQKAHKYTENRGEKVRDILKKELEKEQITGYFYALPLSERRKLKEQSRTEIDGERIDRTMSLDKKYVEMFKKLESRPKVSVLH